LNISSILHFKKLLYLLLQKNVIDFTDMAHRLRNIDLGRHRDTFIDRFIEENWSVRKADQNLIGRNNTSAMQAESQ